MSYSQRNTANKITSIKKQFCKVCFDAGKDETLYSNHYVKSKQDHNGNSKITCPTLLNTECRYCYKLGHTAKFCQAILNKSNNDSNNESKLNVDIKKNNLTKASYEKSKNAFVLLSNDSDDEDELQTKEEYPTLSGFIKDYNKLDTQLHKSIKPISYASMVETKQTPKAIVSIKQIPIKQMISNKEISIVKWKPHAANINWADDSDSDDDDYENHYDNHSHNQYGIY
jgi:hypothetical protein